MHRSIPRPPSGRSRPPKPPRRDGRRALGRRGAWIAALYLTLSGARVIGRNVRTPYGEIDLVAVERRPWALVIVEVKTRRDQRPLEVSSRQVARIARAAQFLHGRYLRTSRRADVGARIDLIDVRLPRRWFPWPRPFPRIRRMYGAWGAERTGRW